MRTVLVSLFIASLFIVEHCDAQNKPTTERTTFERFIAVDSFKLRVPAFKHRRSKELETMAAMVINNALDRMIDILGKSAKSSTENLRTYVNQKELLKGNNDYVHTAYTYAIAEFNAQIKRDNERHGGIGAITKLPIQQKTDIIKLELEELNERYSPIINAINKLKPQTSLPQVLSLEAIEHFKAQ